MVTGHAQGVPDSNPQRSVNNGSTTATRGNLVVTAANQKERGALTTKCKCVLEVLNGKVTYTGNTAVKKTNLSLRRRRLLSFQVAELGNSVGYTAERITCISSISLQGKFQSCVHIQPYLPLAEHN